MRDILERASARETAARVAAGAIARQLLARGRRPASPATSSRIGARRGSRAGIDGVVRRGRGAARTTRRCAAWTTDVERADDRGDRSRAKAAGDTMGGGFEVIATGVPVGLGSYVQWDRKLDGRLAQALMSIPAIKAVGIGLGPEAAPRPGSRVHDEIVLDDRAARTLPASRGRPTTPAGSRAASPTARTSASRPG